jgi:hypothetical protein
LLSILSVIGSPTKIRLFVAWDITPSSARLFWPETHATLLDERMAPLDTISLHKRSHTPGEWDAEKQRVTKELPELVASGILLFDTQSIEDVLSSLAYESVNEYLPLK